MTYQPCPFIRQTSLPDVANGFFDVCKENSIKYATTLVNVVVYTPISALDNVRDALVAALNVIGSASVSSPADVRATLVSALNVVGNTSVSELADVRATLVSALNVVGDISVSALADVRATLVAALNVIGNTSVEIARLTAGEVGNTIEYVPAPLKSVAYYAVDELLPTDYIQGNCTLKDFWAILLKIILAANKRSVDLPGRENPFVVTGGLRVPPIDSVPINSIMQGVFDPNFVDFPNAASAYTPSIMPEAGFCPGSLFFYGDSFAVISCVHTSRSSTGVLPGTPYFYESSSNESPHDNFDSPFISGFYSKRFCDYVSGGLWHYVNYGTDMIGLYNLSLYHQLQFGKYADGKDYYYEYAVIDETFPTFPGFTVNRKRWESPKNWLYDDGDYHATLEDYYLARSSSIQVHGYHAVRGSIMGVEATGGGDIPGLPLPAIFGGGMPITDMLILGGLGLLIGGVGVLGCNTRFNMLDNSR